MPEARSKKSPGAFRTISEVAEELDLPPHVLRFWETKFSQVRPLKRGGGRRYYRPEDVRLIRHIRDLLYNSGYTIKGVQKLIRDGNLKKAGEIATEGKKSVNPEVSIDSDIKNAIDELEALRAEIELHR